LNPDERDPVKYIDNEECAYVMQRYRECHDIYHAILGLPPSLVEGELALKAFEFVNTGLPMTALSLLALARRKPKERERFFRVYLPWALKCASSSKPLINVYWEEELSTDLDVLLSRLNLRKPPDMYDLRREAKRSRNAES
jgi:ubiquinone biosynthesis protein COQ4